MDAIKLILAFAPWIAFWIISLGHSMLWLKIGIATAALLVIVMGITKLHRGMVLMGRGGLLRFCCCVGDLDRKYVGNSSFRVFGERYPIYGHIGVDIFRSTFYGGLRPRPRSKGIMGFSQLYSRLFHGYCGLGICIFGQYSGKCSQTPGP